MVLLHRASQCSSNSETMKMLSDKKRLWKVNIVEAWDRFVYFVEDWAYLAILGILMGGLAVLIDYIIDRLNQFHFWAYAAVRDVNNPAGMYSATIAVWLGYVVLLVAASAILTHYIGSQAIGSGLPEMKTILRGVVLKEFLTVRTMLSKIIGIVLVAGSGLPVGKVGPYVHISSALASQLSRLVRGYKGVYENESRSSEMLAAGCAVGVSCTFSSPVGGVLFTIEGTSALFAVRNYWRGFFAATCAAVVMRILLPLINEPQLALYAFFQTHFIPGKSFTLQELPVFALLGAILGVFGAAFVLIHRHMVFFLRRNWLAKRIFQRYWLLYAGLVAVAFASVTYPEGLGRYMNGRSKFVKTLYTLFANCTWSQSHNHSWNCEHDVIAEWTGPDGSTPIFLSLSLFFAVNFFFSIVCATIPTPNGIFIPTIVVGAAFGRLCGEIMSTILGGEIGTRGGTQAIMPGIYAVVGAAALPGAVTHTVSVAVIAFEFTGQILFLLPVMIAVIVSNAVASHLQPSIFDSIIRMKKLPYLPDLRHTSSIFHAITVDKVMVSPVVFIARDSTYRHLQNILSKMPKLRAFPIVESKKSMVLLGSVNRTSLIRILNEKVGTLPRQEEARRRLHDVSSRDSSLEGHHQPTPNSEITFTSEAPTTPKTLKDVLRDWARKPFREQSSSNSSCSHLDLFGGERDEWEKSRLRDLIDLSSVPVDPTPFQILFNTSLLKVYSVFSLLGLNRAYVTRASKLIGIREAVEQAHKGELKPDDPAKAEQKPVTETPRKDIYDEDDTDYEDNLLGKSEVVRNHGGTANEEAENPYAVPITSLVKDTSPKRRSPQGSLKKSSSNSMKSFRRSNGASIRRRNGRGLTKPDGQRDTDFVSNVDTDPKAP